MSDFHKIKRKLNIFMSNITWLKNVYQILIKCNYIIFHWDERKRMIHPGKRDSHNTYYVIRPRGKSEGLLSSWFYVFENVKWALEKNYIPYVDFETENCQYYVANTINGTNNAWEYFFRQPKMLSKQELKEKKNVLLSGWSFGSDNENIPEILFEDLNKESFICVRNMLKVQPYIEKMVAEAWKQNFCSGGGRNALWVFL